MKGLFIPDITAEMFRNGCLESIESLMAEGEIYDIEYNKDPHWIPCSERLPSDSDYYLVTDAYGDMSAIWFAHEKDYYGESEWRETEDEILAWMPLPEPYKEEGGESE